MFERIVADGADRYRPSPELRAQLRALHDSIVAKHADELATAGWLRRKLLHWRIAAEYRRECRRLLPSDRSLYSSRISAGAV